MTLESLFNKNLKVMGFQVIQNKEAVRRNIKC